MTTSSKLLSLVAIVGALMVSPGAMALDRQCDCRHSRHLQPGSIADERGRSCQGAIDGHGLAHAYRNQAHRPGRGDRDGWTRPVPDLREYGLY